jgi:hypothetical protein
MDEAASVSFQLSVDQSETDADDVDVITRRLVAQLRAEDIDTKLAGGDGKVPQGTRSGDSISVGQIIVTIAPLAIPALAEVLRTWIEARAKQRRISIKVGDSSVELDAQTTPPEYLTQLGRLARSLRPK